MTYSAIIEYRNRTTQSIEVRIKWTTTIDAWRWTTYGQCVNVWTNADASSATICSPGTWKNQVNYKRACSALTEWMLVTLDSADATKADISLYYFQTNEEGLDMYQVNRTAHIRDVWTIEIPAFEN